MFTVVIYEERLFAMIDTFLFDETFLDFILRRDIKHDLAHNVFNYGAKPARTRILLNCLLSDCLNGFGFENKVNIIHLKHLLINSGISPYFIRSSGLTS